MSQLQEERIQLGPRHLEEELQDLRWEVDILRHERDNLVADRRSVGSDTTMAVVGVTGPSSDRMAALIEEGELKRRKMEAPSPRHDDVCCERSRVRVVGNACGRGLSSRPTIETVTESVFHAP